MLLFKGTITVVCFCLVSFYLQDNVVVQDVEGIIQGVDGQVRWPLQTHLCYKHTETPNGCTLTTGRF